MKFVADLNLKSYSVVALQRAVIRRFGTSAWEMLKVDAARFLIDVLNEEGLKQFSGTKQPQSESGLSCSIWSSLASEELEEDECDA